MPVRSTAGEVSVVSSCLSTPRNISGTTAKLPSPPVVLPCAFGSLNTQPLSPWVVVTVQPVAWPAVEVNGSGAKPL